MEDQQIKPHKSRNKAKPQKNRRFEMLKIEASRILGVTKDKSLVKETSDSLHFRSNRDNVDNIPSSIGFDHHLWHLLGPRCTLFPHRYCGHHLAARMAEHDVGYDCKFLSWDRCKADGLMSFSLFIRSTRHTCFLWNSSSISNTDDQPSLLTAQSHHATAHKTLDTISRWNIMDMVNKPRVQEIATAITKARHRIGRVQLTTTNLN